jgi:biopolymer transport protein ExbB
MNLSDPIFRRLFFWVAACGAMLLAAWHMPALLAQAAAPKPAAQPTMEETKAAREAAAKKAEEFTALKDTKTDADDAASQAAAEADVPPIDVIDLVKAGGLELLAIVLVSVVALAFAVERFLALRRHNVIPSELLTGLERLSGQKGDLDLKQGYRLCQEFPSTAATVVKTLLAKTGRPTAELEQTLAEVGEREASRLYSNVRWQNLAFNVAPMLGLLGTIQGMIVAFYLTSHLPANMNKAEHLADGIYRALVNTFAGLAVAIPAAILAHVLEGRIIKLMTELDDFARGLLPQLERFEGRPRVNREQLDRPEGEPLRAAPETAARKNPAAKPQ